MGKQRRKMIYDRQKTFKHRNKMVYDRQKMVKHRRKMVYDRLKMVYDRKKMIYDRVMYQFWAVMRRFREGIRRFGVMCLAAYERLGGFCACLRENLASRAMVMWPEAIK